MNTYLPTSAHMKVLGRCASIPEGLWLCWSGSGAEFTFTGKELQITILGDDRASLPDSGADHARIAIEIDGERVISQQITQQENMFRFGHAESKLWHVRVLKLSESAMATCVLSNVQCDGQPAPTADKPHSIEVVGDSITCGYGIDDPFPEHPFHTATEDVTKAYAYLTAEQLDADYAIVSLSGWGIISGYTGNGQRQPHQLLPSKYDKIGHCDSSFRGRFPQNADWDFGQFLPDAVVVNLGTNDDSFTGEDKERREEYCREYRAFLKTLRSRNPSAFLLCTLGMMGDRLYPMVEKAVNEYRAETGDSNVEAFRFVPQTDADGYSSDWHPSCLTQQRAANALVCKLRQKMGW